MDQGAIILISLLVIVIALDRMLKKSGDHNLKVYSPKQSKLFTTVTIIFFGVILPLIITRVLWNQYIDSYTYFQTFIKYEVGYIWIILYLILLVILITFSYRKRWLVKNSLRIFEIVKDKPRHLIAVFFGIVIIKILIHYLVYPATPESKEELIKYGISWGEFFPFRYYLREVFFSEILLFVPAIAILSLIIWFFWPVKTTNKV